MKDDAWIVITGVCCGVILSAVGGCGLSYGLTKEQSRAVAAGVAEWTYTTNSLGQLTQSGFRYKTNSISK